MALFGLAGTAGASTRTGGTGTEPWISSELPDYAPGSVVNLLGGSWQPGEAVHIAVNDDQGQTWSRAVDVTADANGDIADSFTLPDWFVATYSVTATGASSGTATSTFTDGNVRARVAGGPTSATITWEKFTGNATCSGTPSSTGSATVGTSVTGLGIPSGVAAGQSARLTAPAITGFTFGNWSGAASSSSTAVCVPGSSANQIDMTATYAPGVNTTTVTQSKTATYGDASVTLTATVTPASGPAVNTGTVTFTVNGTPVTSGTVSAGSATASFSLVGVQAASYAIAATYNAGSGFNGSTNSAQSPAPALDVNKAASTTTVTCGAGPFVYDGAAKTPCTASVTGAGGLSQSVTVSYSANVDAGTATATAVYPGDTNHTGSSDSKSFAIGKAGSTTTVTCPAGPFVYNGSPHTPCSAGVSGAGGLNQTLSVDYSGNVDAGSASASATYAGDANHAGSSDSTSFTIERREVTASIGAADKTYDGGETAELTGCALEAASGNHGVVSGEDVGCTASNGRFADANAGNGKTVTADVALSGADLANYRLTSGSASTSATIGKAELHISAVGESKVYDGGTSSSATPTVSGLQDDDSVDGLAQWFQSKNALGNGNSVLEVSAYSVHDGNSGDNYDVHTHTAAGTISAKGLTLAGAAANDKTYDGTDAATIDLSGASLSGAVSGDDVAIDHSGYEAHFDDRHVGTDKPVTVTGVALSGADAGNYAVSQPSGLKADIEPLAISGSFDSADKVYDGTVAAAATNRQLSGVLGSDDVSLSGGTASFDTKNVGTGKPVSLSGAALVGADKDNYSLSSVADAHADITGRDLTVTAHGFDRTYDGTTDAAVTLSTDKLSGDTVNAVYTSAAFATKHAGPGKSVSVSGISISGADAGNYELLNTSASTSAAIFKRPLGVSAVADTKVYDGTTSSDETPVLSSGTIASGDTADFAQAYATKTVGSGKTLIPSGSVLDGNGGDNYDIAFLNARSGVITAKNLTVSGITADDKPFDGNTSATLDVSGAALVGVVSGDAVTLGTGAASGAFTSSAPGTCTVQVSGLAIAGADSANYTLTQPVVPACIGAWYANGFYAPVGVGNSQFVTSPGTPPAVSPVSTVWNIAKGGSTIPLKFNLYTSQGGAERTNVADIRSFDAVKLSCSTGEGEAAVDFITTGNTSLRYDGSQFIQNWKTPSSSTDTCYRASVKFQDGSAIYAFFKLRK